MMRMNLCFKGTAIRDKAHMESIYLEKLAIAVKADDSPNPNPYPRMKAWEWAEDAARFMDENFA